MRDEITDQDIMRECATFRDSLRMSWKRSGKTIEQLAIDILGERAELKEIANLVKNLSRIINPSSPEDKRNLDGELFIPYMSATGNAIPLRWLNIKYSGNVSRVSLDDVIHKLDSLEGLHRAALRQIHHATKRVRAKGLYSVKPHCHDEIPAWVAMEAENIFGGCVNG